MRLNYPFKTALSIILTLKSITGNEETGDTITIFSNKIMHRING